jgi:hypothetical protein
VFQLVVAFTHVPVWMPGLRTFDDSFRSSPDDIMSEAEGKHTEQYRPKLPSGLSMN